MSRDALQARRAGLVALKIDLQHRLNNQPGDEQTYIELERVKTELASLKLDARLTKPKR